MMNSTSSSNSSVKPTTCQPEQPDQLTAVSFSISYGVILVVAMIGNSLVINFARTNRRMKSNVFHMFLICMATADIIDVLFVVPLHWVYFYYRNIWIGGIFGEFSCKVIYFSVDTSIFASVLTLVVITIDRYFAICHIDHTPLLRVKTRFIIIGIWIGSGLLSALQLYKFQIVDYNGQSYCVSNWNSDTVEKDKLKIKYEMTIKFALSYGIPLLLMIVLYALIIRKLRRRLHSCVVEENQELQRQIAHQNRPLVEMFITLVTIFAVCWFPVHVNHMLIAFDFQTYLCLPTAVPLVFYFLAHANAAINPLLYFIFISGFRKELKKKASVFWNWATTKSEATTSSTWLSYLRSRSPSLRRRKNTHRGDNAKQNNNKNLNQRLNTNRSTPEPLAVKILDVNTAGSTNQGLSIEADVTLIHGLPDPSPQSPVERDMGKDLSFVQGRNSRVGSHSIPRSTVGTSNVHSPARSISSTSYTNGAYDTGNNNMLPKSASLPWKLSTFV